MTMCDLDEVKGMRLNMLLDDNSLKVFNIIKYFDDFISKEHGT